MIRIVLSPATVLYVFKNSVSPFLRKQSKFRVSVLKNPLFLYVVYPIYAIFFIFIVFAIIMAALE